MQLRRHFVEFRDSGHLGVNWWVEWQNEVRYFWLFVNLWITAFLTQVILSISLPLSFHVWLLYKILRSENKLFVFKTMESLCNLKKCNTLIHICMCNVAPIDVWYGTELVRHCYNDIKYSYLIQIHNYIWF